MDRRFLPQTLSQVRAINLEEDNAKYVIGGTGIVFDQLSEKMGWFVETVERDAVAEADVSDVMGYFNHSPIFTLGRTGNKTMRLNLTREAMKYEIDAPQTQTISDLVLAPINRGDVWGSSFMFDILEDYWEEKDGVCTRYVKKIGKIYEMGPVSMPAYSQTDTSVAKRSFDAFIEQTKKVEEQNVSRYLANKAKREVMMLQR